MTDKHSKAKKEYWSKFTPEQRSIHMSKMAKTKWKNTSEGNRKKHAKMMAQKRWAKYIKS